MLESATDHPNHHSHTRQGKVRMPGSTEDFWRRMSRWVRRFGLLLPLAAAAIGLWCIWMSADGRVGENPLRVAVDLGGNPAAEAVRQELDGVPDTLSQVQSDPGSDKTLTGEAAKEQLRKSGQYESLGAAFQAARYAVEKIDPADQHSRGADYFAANPRQQLRAWFRRDGVELASGRPTPEGREPWSMMVRLRAVGRGGALSEVMPASTKGEGSRVEMAAADGSITQWFENKEDGIEQGFTVARKPMGDGALEVLLAIEGTLRAEAHPNDEGGRSGVDAIRFVGADDGAALVSYSGLKVWDATGRELPAWMEVRDASVALVVTDTGAQYPVTVDPLFANVQARLVGEFVAEDRFGASVALSEDGNTALVGAPYDATPAANQVGSAYVFVRSGTTWNQQAKLTANDGDAFDSFGSSVAVSADTAVVGTPDDETPTAFQVGSAYVFVRSGLAWSQQAKLVSSDSASFDCFGSSVAVSGDTVLVGTPKVPPSLAVGSAYVYVRSGTTWSQQAKFVASDGAVNDRFGSSVSLSGTNALVGAPGKNSAYVYVRDGTNWSQQAKLTASDGVLGDTFGSSVSLSGETALVGAAAASTSGRANTGTAYVFVRSGTSWSQQAKLIASDAAVGDAFGSVALSGDTALVGASRDDTTAGNDAGSAYLFVRSGTTWSQQAKFVASDGAANDSFGQSVALCGNTALAGAALHATSAGRNAGSTYVFVRSGTTWSRQVMLVASDAAANDYLGTSVALSGDTALVGARGDATTAGSYAGSAYVFVRSGTIWNQQVKLTASDGAADDEFGFSSALSGDTAMVGARGDDTAAGSGAGSAYVFVRNGTTWGQQAKLVAGNGAADSQFGYSVALDGNSALIGTYARGAYVFVRSGTTWSQQAQVIASGLSAGAEFGCSLALSGDTALIGAKGDGAGSAYVYVRSGTNWSQQAKLIPNDGGSGHSFGCSLALSGDTALVGARGHTVLAGSAYVYVRSGTTWNRQAKLTASNGVVNNQFGYSVGLSGDTAVVGAPYTSTAAGTDAGSAYVFVRSGTIWTERVQLTAGVDSSPFDFFGQAVALDGNTACVSAYQDDTAGSDAGSAYTFLLGELPSITQQPISRTVVPGATVNFSIVAIGYAPLLYRWRLDGSDIAGANSANLTIQVPAQAPFDSVVGSYDCIVSNIGGVVISAPATLAVNALSRLVQVTPGMPPDAEGYVFATLYPAEARGGWRFVGEQQWRSSGVPVGGLTTGDYDIEFKPVSGYIQPPRESISVFSGQAATWVERTYFASADAGSGGLTVFLKPDDLADLAVAEAQRAQWRLLGDDDTQWRDSGSTLGSLLPGDYLIECKPVAGRSTPPSSLVRVLADQTSSLTVTYRLADPPVGVAPTAVPFETVSGDSSKPYGFVGQIRSDVGSSSGFLIKPRVVATAGHVVFDDGTLSAVTGLQWLHQRHRGTYESAPRTPRGYYIFDGYAAQRGAENTPGSSSPQSQHLDAAAIYFLEDVGRGGASGYLASDLDDNEFLLSSSDKVLAGYPVDGVSSSQQGRMHATAPMNAIFTRGYGRTFLSSDIRGMGGMSGGPLCVRYNNGSYYPAAIYLGGSGQTVVRAIDSQIIDLFNRAEVSGNGGDNNTGGGISHTSFTSIGFTSLPGAVKVNILPLGTVGAAWSLSPNSTWRPTGQTVSNLAPGNYILKMKEAGGYQTPANATVNVSGGKLTTVTYTYAPIVSPPVISSAGTVSGVRGQAMSYQITASNSPTSYGLTGTLPSGLTLNTSTGLISGTPQEFGIFNVTLQATNAGGTGTKALAITVTNPPPVISSAGTVSGVRGQTMSYQITASNSPTSYGLTGTMPSGLTLNTATGLISGSPQEVGTFDVTLRATNAGGTGTKALAITVTGTPLDNWRMANFSTMSDTGSAADLFDFDGDGQHNLEEFAAGTDPKNGADFFKVTSTTRTPGGFVVTAAGKGGRVYVLQRRVDLAVGEWGSVDTIGPLAADQVVTLTDLALPSGSAFYRIQVVVP